MKMVLGIQQKDAGVRRAAFLVHCSLVEKRANIQKIWPLPFDDNSIDEEKKLQYQLLKAQLKLKANGN